MSKLNISLAKRFKTQKIEKIDALVKRSNSGELSSFSGVFQITSISEKETASLKLLLEKYQTKQAHILPDLDLLKTLTSEIKSISSQAIILHGSRIKKARELFKKYKEGAFSTWLVNTYGNRQTPYNFLLYYELFSSLPPTLHTTFDEMPRQAIYSLSSRAISQEEKISFIKTYQGENKKELLEKLRQSFPLPPKDKRSSNKKASILKHLNQVLKITKEDLFSPTEEDKKTIKKLLKEIGSLF